MRKLLVIIAMHLAVISGRAQNPPERAGNELNTAGWGFLYSMNGEPFSVTKFAKVVDGSPFFIEEWIKGSIVLSNGNQYNNVPLRLNLLENKVHYLDNKGQEWIANTPIWEVKLPDSTTNAVNSFVHSSFIGPGKNSDMRCWLLILQTGHIGLYKQFYKSVSESRPYGAATAEQRIRTIPRYYILKENEIKKVKDWQDLVDLLSDRKADIQGHISDHKLKGKSELDFVSLVKFYNGLTW